MLTGSSDHAIAHRWLLGLLLCASLLAALPATAADDALKTIDKQLQTLRSQLDKSLWPSDLDATWNAIDASRREAKKCSETATKDAETLEKDLGALGEPKREDDAGTKEVRRILKKAKEEREGLHARCRALELAAGKLQETLQARRDQDLSAALSSRYINLPDLLAGEVPLVDLDPLPVVRSVQMDRLGWSPNPWRHGLWLALLSLVGWLIAGAVARHLIKLEPLADNAGFGDRALCAFLSSLKAHLSGLLAVTIWLAYWGVQSWRQDAALPMLWLMLALLGYLGLRVAIDMLLQPRPPARLLLDFDPTAARRFGRMVKLGALLPLALVIAYLVPRQDNLSEALLALVRLGALTAFLLLLAGLTHTYFNLRNRHQFALRRVVVGLAFAAVWVCELLGYRGLSQFLLIGVLGTLGLFGLGWFLSSLWTDGLDALDEGRYQWQKKLRQRLELEEDQGVPGLVWLRLVGSLVIWVAVGWGLMAAWGATAAQRAHVVAYLTDGFTLGTVSIVPARIAMALLLFAVLAALAGWFKRQLEQRWLGRARMDSGAKNALVTLVGYVGVGIGLMIALSMAGVDFSSLALIAGALSVGIGFGLQNIVNNFVSGLILLFERPVRKGDWIVVGNTEGYVDKIAIRSTVIRTFDRSEVIVPNSELISNQVTNWMLSDRRGRVVAPVGVAYGSDVGLVKEILLKIGKEHPERMRFGMPEPQVLFMGFGDSSLDFQLRFFVRDVDKRLAVLSDVNFAIDKAFRENGIEIPFPQRVVHMAAANDPSATPSKDPQDDGAK